MLLGLFKLLGMLFVILYKNVIAGSNLIHKAIFRSFLEYYTFFLMCRNIEKGAW